MNTKTKILSMVALASILTTNSFADSSIYIWSKSFDSVSNQKIIKLMNKYNIHQALISFKKDQSNKFLAIKMDRRIKAIPIIANNTYVYKKNRYKLDKKVNYLEMFSHEIHLDIEPYALSELKHHRKKYFKMYLDMLNHLHNYYPQIKFDISIPVFYHKMSNFSELKKYVNNIYIMAYKNKNQKHLLKEISYFSKNTYIVQNCKEFKSKAQLVKTINFIKQNGYNNIGFHNWKTFNKLK